ncbi:MAG: CoA transferase, partial [Candidatus Hydrogenedentes bacterium]|nr:CoA transferase [Candidatus Hydrogenedentota bacterium]
GQFIDVAMYDVLVWMTAEFWPRHFNGEQIPARMGNAHYRHAPNNAYPARDRLVVVAVETDGQWNRLLEAMGCDDLTIRERFSSGEGRIAQRKEVDALVAAWVKDLAAAEVVDRCQGAGVPAAPVLELSEIASHPHVLARRMIVEVPLHTGGPEHIKLLGCPIKLSASPADVYQGAPRLGEHNRDVYCGMLNYSAAQLEDLQARGIV